MEKCGSKQSARRKLQREAKGDIGGAQQEMQLIRCKSLALSHSERRMSFEILKLGSFAFCETTSISDPCIFKKLPRYFSCYAPDALWGSLEQS